jgi:uncharacterized membrane protein
VYRGASGRLRLDHTLRPTPRMGATLGGVFGVILGAIIAAPFTVGASATATAVAIGAGAATLGTSGAITGAEDAAKREKQPGLTEDFVKQVGGMVRPGQSALFLVVDPAEPERVVECFRGYGGTVLRTTLPSEKAASLQRALDDRRPLPT